MTRRRLFTLLLGIGLLGTLSYFRLREEPPASSAQDGSRPVPGKRQLATFQGEIFGTIYRVKARLFQGVTSELAQKEVLQALKRVDRLMSTYKEDSELSQLNQADAGTFHPVSPELFSVLELAREVHTQTHGAFDVTVGPLVRAWGFGAEAAHQPPDQARLDRLLSRVGTRHLRLAQKDQSVKKEIPGLEIDLSAIAKGYGVDQAARALENLSVTSYLVEVGGEIRVLGQKAPGTPWKLGIEKPQPDERTVFDTISMTQGALATSGDYRSFREVDGHLISHTIDPRTGRPVPRRTASVSVVRPTAAEADALATGLTVLRPPEALALAEDHDWAVLLLLHKEAGRGFEPRTSTAWVKLNR